MNIQPVCRILFYFAATFSLLLCIATVLLWMRGRSIRDSICWVSTNPPYTRTDVTSNLGIIFSNCTELSRVSPSASRGTTFAHWTDQVDDRIRAGHRDAYARSTWHGFAGRYCRDDPSAPHGTGAGTAWQLRYYWCLPHWFLVVITALLPVAAANRLLRKRRTPAGHCIACGYDCRATPDRCPECGIAPSEAWERRMRCKEATLKPLEGTLRVKARPAEPDQQPEASLASWAGDRRGEA